MLQKERIFKYTIFVVKQSSFERFDHFFNSIHQNILLKFEFFNDFVAFLFDVMTINKISFVMLLINATKRTRKRLAITKDLLLFRLEMIFRQLFYDNLFWFVKKNVFHNHIQFSKKKIKFFDQKSSTQYIKLRLNRMLTCRFDDVYYSFKKHEQIFFDDAITFMNKKFNNIFHFEVMNFVVLVEFLDLLFLDNNKMMTHVLDYWMNIDFEIFWMHELLIIRIVHEFLI